MAANQLPEEVTSYDLVKTFAVIVMVIDHLGYYFFYDDLWWRAVGRIGFPVWFFLLGYSTGRNVPGVLIAAACVMQIAHSIVGMSFFPLNALVTIIAIRLVLDPVMKFALRDPVRLWLLSIGLAVVAIPSYALMEYGSLGLITAMFGYLVRHRQAGNDEKLVFTFMIFALLVFVGYQQVNFEFSAAQFAFMALGTAVVRYTLLRFRPMTYPAFTARYPRWLISPIRLCGRRTLEIYVGHLLLFDALGVLLEMPGMVLFQWRLGLPAWAF